MPLTKEQKTAIIEDLVINCGAEAGPWSPGDKAALTALPDDKLQALHVQAEAVVNAMDKDDEDDDDEDTTPKGKSKKGKIPPQFQKNNATPPTTISNDAGKAPQTDEEWLAQAPAGIRAVVTNAIAAETKQKEGLVKQITANEKNTYTPEFLMTKDPEELTALAALATNSTVEEVQAIPHFIGAAPGAGKNRTTNRGAGFADEDQDMVFEPMAWDADV